MNSSTFWKGRGLVLALCASAFLPRAEAALTDTLPTFRIRNLNGEPLSQVRVCNFFDVSDCRLSDAEGRVRWVGPTLPRKGGIFPGEGGSAVRPGAPGAKASFRFRRTEAGLEINKPDGCHAAVEVLALSGRVLFRSQARAKDGVFLLNLPPFPQAGLFYRLRVDGEEWVTAEIPTVFSSVSKELQPPARAAARQGRASREGGKASSDGEIDWLAFRLTKTGYKSKPVLLHLEEGKFDLESRELFMPLERDSGLAFSPYPTRSSYRIHEDGDRIIEHQEQYDCEGDKRIRSFRVDTLPFRVREGHLGLGLLSSHDFVDFAREKGSEKAHALAGTWVSAIPLSQQVLPVHRQGEEELLKDEVRNTLYRDWIAGIRLRITADSLFRQVELRACPIAIRGGLYLNEPGMEISNGSCRGVRYRRKKDGAEAELDFEETGRGIRKVFRYGNSVCRLEGYHGEEAQSPAEESCGLLERDSRWDFEACVKKTGFFEEESF